MYGTVAKMKATPGSGEMLAELANQVKEAPPAGLVGTWIYKLDADPDSYLVVVAFESRESYWANAESPEQDAQYRKLRALLAEDPEWNDGEIVYSQGVAAG